jgi:uncharacterized protein (DUF1800 family)
MRVHPLKALLAAVFVGHLGTSLALAIDDDNDGLSDVWQLGFGPKAFAGADPDGDGQINEREDEAGTNPYAASSRHALFDVSSPQANHIRISWPGVSGKIYDVAVSRDLSEWESTGELIPGAGGIIERTYATNATLTTGSVAVERWNFGGYTSFASFKQISATTAPAQTTFATSLTVPQTSPDASNFGRRIHGYIVPPTSGTYTFWIASDDSSELWLSSDAAQSNKLLVASVTGYTGATQWTKYPTQQSAPRALIAGRCYYFEAYQVEGSGGDHVSIAWTPPSGGPQVVIPGSAITATAVPTAFRSGAKVWFRVNVRDLDTDADGVTDYEERLVNLDPANTRTIPRVNDLDSVRRLVRANNTITAGAAVARAYESPATPGRFTLFRSGGFSPLTVRYTLSGSALSGADYGSLTGVAEFARATNEVSIDVNPVTDGIVEPAEPVTLTVQPDASYELGSPSTATLTIDDAPDVLYVAMLRSSSALSGASGYAQVRMAGNQQFAMVSLSFTNLASTQLGTEFVATIGGTSRVVLSYPPGQIAPMRWDFTPAAGLSRAQIISALMQGQLGARVNSTTFSTGEITGVLLPSPQWDTPPLPPSPPSAPVTAASDEEAMRFLTQATFGAKLSDAASVRSRGYAGWIADQIALSPSLHLPYVQARRAELLQQNPDDDGWQRPRQEAWWERTILAPDQLRQRMAFALSELFVISQVGALDGDHEGTALYYDMLVENAFGNYRDVLEKVTLSPMMGIYLSMMRNQKPNPDTGAEPDENYSREIMQLLSIGLNTLHPDGTIKLNAEGFPIPTYTQADIVGLAHVFTGWGPHYDDANPPHWDNGQVAPKNDWFIWGSDSMRPMTAYENFHDTKSKTIVGNALIPANQTCAQDLDQALDVIANHPNVGPFVAKHLIQRFVTSNPSPGYVRRVATIFNNNGSGVRGDLGAVIRSVLLDSEARHPDYTLNAAYGKLREPLLRVSHLLRAFPLVRPVQGDTRLFIDLQYDLPQQAALMSPSVFNFFQPGYSHPGRIARAGLLSPEFQMLSEITIMAELNGQRTRTSYGIWTPYLNGGATARVTIDFSTETALLNTSSVTNVQTALIDRLNLVLLNGRMTAPTRTAIEGLFTRLPSWYDYTTTRGTDRVRAAVHLIMTSPEYAIQK